MPIVLLTNNSNKKVRLTLKHRIEASCDSKKLGIVNLGSLSTDVWKWEIVGNLLEAR